jgi:DnaJ-domain-containing protein 1
MARAKKKPFNGYVPGQESTPEEPVAHRCEWSGCGEPADHHAPRSRDRMDDQAWFCLDHIRAYHATWNYYEGMSEQEVEAEIRRDTIGRRPTWPFGTRAATMRFMRGQFGDSFGLFEEDANPEPGGGAGRYVAPGSPEERAYVVLDLAPPISTNEVKKRYKQLVKRYHPDANGGDKEAEERFKEINLAYHTLMDSLSASDQAS